MTHEPSPTRHRALILAIGVLLVAFAVPLCRRSLTLADEGYILLQSFDMLHGKVLYRDMDAFVTPGIWILLVATFKLLGPSVIASRVPVLIALMAMYAAGYRITARLAGPRYGLATVALLAVCTVWAFPAWTFAFYSPFAVTAALLALDRVLAWRDTRARRDLFVCGILVGVSILFKQNYGVFALAGLALGAVATHREDDLGLPSAIRAAVRDGVPVAAGAALVALPVAVYLGLEGALAAAWRSLVVHPFEFSGKHDIPYLPLSAIAKSELMQSGTEMLTYAAQPIYRVPPATGWLREIGLVERLHVVFYWAPPVILVLGAALSYRPGPAEPSRSALRRPVDAGLLSVVAVAAAVFLGVFPRADFNHLANVYQPIVIAAVVVFHHVWQRRSRPTSLAVRCAAGAGGLLLSLYVATAGYWYYGLLEYLGTPVDVERAGVLAREEQAQRIRYAVETIQTQTEPGEAVLTLPDLSMLNFLADRPMPSEYYNLYEHHIAHDRGAAVVAGAEARHVRLAITRFNDFFSDRVGLRDYAPELTRYLATHYELTYLIGTEDFMVFERREEPIELPETIDVLDYCDTSAGYQRIQEHLLFPALYHDPGTGVEMTIAAMETPCEIPVPASGGVLSVRIGYRAPARVVRSASLTAEIIAIGEVENELLLRREFNVVGRGADIFRRRPYHEYRIDLSPWAGKSLDLRLRTTRRGKVLVRPLERRGFGTTWEAPVIELPRAQAAPG